MVAKFRNTGQSCVAANRFIVEAPVEQELTARLVERIGALKVGRGSEPGVGSGPLINDAAVAKVRRLIEDALRRGARLVHGEPPSGEGRLVAPVVLADITPEMEIWREEIFGPVVAIRAAATEAEALAQANDTEYGLVAYVYTRSEARWTRFAEGLGWGWWALTRGWSRRRRRRSAGSSSRGSGERARVTGSTTTRASSTSRRGSRARAWGPW